MPETIVKLRPDADQETAAQPPKVTLRDWLRAHLRLILLVILPLLAATAGLVFYLSGGRYVSTDNAYVGAQKVLITPDISGKISHASVREGQHGLAVTQAQSKLDSVRTDFANLKSNLQSFDQLVELSQKNIELKQHDVDRKKPLIASHVTSQVDLDNATVGLVTAKLQGQLAVQQRASVLNQLLGKPDLPIEQFPPYQQAEAALEQAQRDLDHTSLKAPINGTATQVDNIQLGRFVTAGTPVLSVINDSTPWVDANPKETDLTYLRVGQKVTVDVDAFPDRTFHGTVASVFPATGAQFAILPPQNASGNWVKVVQRVPVRIAFDQGQNLRLLRAGMSVTVDIDTGHRRSLAALLGVGSSAAREGAPEQPK